MGLKSSKSASNFFVLYKALFIKDKDKRLQTLRTLIDSGKDVNSCWNGGNLPMLGFQREGLTVLMVAARNGYVDCVQVLIDAGAKVDQSDRLGETALMTAAIFGNDKCVKLLIEAEAYVHLSDKYGLTALMLTAKFASVKCMELLLEAGADVNGVDARGNTALIYCLRVYSDSKVCFKLLIDAGADIDVRNNNNLQPIHFALKLWKLQFPVEYLISENCNLSHASYQVKACIDEDYVDFLKLDVNGRLDRLDMLKLLFACGLPRHLCQSFIVEQHTSVRTWIETVASQPDTLKSICVFKIRKTLGPGIKSKVTKLNLPNVIQNLILLKGILSLDCFD